MAKFKIPETPPTVNKTVRFPADVVAAVEEACTDSHGSCAGFLLRRGRM